MEKRNWFVFLAIVVVLVIGMLVAVPLIVKSVITQTVDTAMAPIEQTSEQLKTQVSNVLHPTPTIMPDPVTIIREMRSLARLETIQYSVEKVITAEIGQGEFGFLFGDRLLFVAHGIVIAGIDLDRTMDVEIDAGDVYVTLAEPEIFVATLDNDKSYVYDRDTGVLTHGDPNLETSARKVAVEEIEKAAIEDGILDLAKVNAENYLSRFIRSFGYQEVYFNYVSDSFIDDLSE